MIDNLLSLVIIPHGITDIILSYENNCILQMILYYSILPIIVTFMSVNMYNYLFILSSIIHFRHDLLSIIPYTIILSYFFGEFNYNDSYSYMNNYLVLFHVPQHYIHIFTITNFLYQHLLIIICFTGISYKISPLLIDWVLINNGQDKLSKYIGGIILSHIYFNEYINSLIY